MSISLNAMGNSVLENASWAVRGITNMATSISGCVVEMGTKAYNSGAGPTLRSLVARIRTLDFQYYANASWTFAKSDLGIGFGLISASLICFGMARKTPSTTKNIALVAAGSLAMLASAAIVIRPGIVVTLLAR